MAGKPTDKDLEKRIKILEKESIKNKRAEEALRKSQQRLSDIIDFLPNATFVIDKAGKVIVWNRAIEEMTKIKAADMLGKDNYEYALPFYGERRPILIDLVLKSRKEIESGYVLIQRRDKVLEGETYTPAFKGGEVYLYGKASILQDSKGNVVGAIESIRDITAHRQTEEKYKAIFENAVMGIYQATPEGRFISANPALARILGYDSPEEVVAMVTDIARQLYVNPEERINFLQLIKEYGAVQDKEIQFFRKDGSIAWLTLNARSVRNSGGKVVYYEGAIRDITEHKLLESQLLQARKMEAIGTLAGGIAHDFNNILSAVIGYAEMGQKYPKVSDRLQRYFEQIYKAGKRAEDLVKHIITFSRQREEKLYPLKIDLIVKEVLKLARATLPATTKIHLKSQPFLNVVLANPTHIRQILMNLCTNAADAIGAQKGALKVELAPEKIKPGDGLIHHGLTPGMHIKLAVSDTGHGIAPEIMDKIFDPFFTTKKPGEGTGMGLSVVHGIVKKCGGAITVQSEVGKGTLFNVYFPLQTGIQGAGQKESATYIAGGKGRILFVDDEETLVDLGDNMLTGLGYQVIKSTSSRKALELFRVRPDRFDLVITDIAMPEMTGIELVQELMLIRPDIPVIICTGFNELITPEIAKSLGLTNIIMKPIVLSQIASSIEHVLEKKLVEDRIKWEKF